MTLLSGVFKMRAGGVSAGSVLKMQQSVRDLASISDGNQNDDEKEREGSPTSPHHHSAVSTLPHDQALHSEGAIMPGVPSR